VVSIANRCGLRRSLSDDPIGVGCARRPGGTGPCNCRPKLSQASPRTRLLQVRFGRPGRALNRPTWSPVNGSSARVSPNRLSYGCPTTIFRDPRNRRRHHLSATLLDGRAGNGWARLLRRGRDRSGGGFPNAGYEPHPSCGDRPLTARSRPKRAAKISRKIVAGQQ